VIATDPPALDLNRKAFNSVLFRPRVLVDVDVCDTSCEMMGQKTTLPIFISPAGMAGLAHPQAERLLAKGAGECGIIQMVSEDVLAHSQRLCVSVSVVPTVLFLAAVN
jgi:L-lactate dehydrogenase (cytochrome)